MPKNIYNTSGRTAVRNLFENNPDRLFGASEVYDELSSNSDSAVPGKSSIYRILASLCDEGILAKQDKDGKKLFRFSESGCAAHLHLMCTGCGKIKHLECDHGLEIVSHIEKDHSFTVDTARSTIFGLCGSCTKKVKSDA